MANLPIQNIPKLSPQQLGFANTSLAQAQPLLQQLMGNKNDFAQAARQNFQQQTVPSIAERFTGLGAGSQRSSAFPSILGQAGANLEKDIALGSRQQDMDLLRLLLGVGMQPQFESLALPEGMSFGQSLGLGASQALPLLLSLLGGAFGGPAGLAGGAAGGNILASLLGNRG